MNAPGKFCQYCGQPGERYLRVESAARLLDCSPETIRGWVRERKIGSVKVGGLRRIPAASLEKITTRIPSIEELVDAAMADPL